MVGAATALAVIAHIPAPTRVVNPLVASIVQIKGVADVKVTAPTPVHLFTDTTGP